jgi:hypothetical protein
VIVASGHAYLNAINRHLLLKEIDSKAQSATP